MKREATDPRGNKIDNNNKNNRGECKVKDQSGTQDYSCCRKLGQGIRCRTRHKV